MIKYVREKRPYLHGKSWIKAKRILAFMNVEVKYFLTIEILLYEGNIKVMTVTYLSSARRSFEQICSHS